MTTSTTYETNPATKRRHHVTRVKATFARPHGRPRNVKPRMTINVRRSVIVEAPRPGGQG